jgi:hypothetical protein
MLELSAFEELALFLVQLYDFDLVLSVFHKRAHCQSDVPLLLVTEIYCVDGPLSFVGIDLLPFGLCLS